jgi:hypothetical protein
VKDYDSYAPPKYIKLNPTGRYKIVYGPQYKDVSAPILYIEHQGRFWKSWVIEMEIVERVEKCEFINECVNVN